MQLPPGLTLKVEDRPEAADVEVLPYALEDYNEERWPGHQKWRELAVFVRDGGQVVAGMAGETYGGWLFVRYLWVAESLRGRGIGRELMQQAEARALQRGCHSVWLDTYGFQARGLYEKLGYSVFGTLDNPTRFFLRKQLKEPPPAASR